jgi:hypothetical protein
LQALSGGETTFPQTVSMAEALHPLGAVAFWRFGAHLCHVVFFGPHASSPNVSKPMLLWVQPLSGRSDAESNLADHVLCEPGLQLPANP